MSELRKYFEDLAKDCHGEIDISLSSTVSSFSESKHLNEIYLQLSNRGESPFGLLNEESDR